MNPLTVPAPVVIGYLRVSTDEQGDSGLGLAAQASAIAAELERRGWTGIADYTDVASGKTTNGRPGLAQAVAHAKRCGGVLVAAKLDRVSRDVIDFASLLSAQSVKGGVCWYSTSPWTQLLQPGASRLCRWPTRPSWSVVLSENARRPL